LESLTLKHCRPQSTDHAAGSVELRSLQTLDLVDADSSISHFMHVVSFPSTTTLDVQCSMINSTEDETTRAISVITSSVARAQNPYSVALSVDEQDIEITVSSSSDAVRPAVHILFVPFSDDHWDYPRLTRMTFKAISGSSLAEVDVRFPVAITGAEAGLPDLWATALGRFQNMRSIRTVRVLGWALCAALVVDRYSGGGGDRLLSPRLEALTLVDVDLFSPRYWEGTLLSLVRSRTGTLKTLRLVGCEHLGREQLIPELRTMVEVEVRDAEPGFVVS